ncbi:restriction endonuclease subunit S [Providencia stuartii]|uniref:restriction endonuclease subunit S n=1 Tax=Providencia stuartii TaxID=588 RepID=UPI0028821A16|nr:restriction endonuclease subunit S [Providencia stuartii]MDK7737737.1 restriction endonuclease subunit S [Providencia stuartii]HEM8345723.1 restriction endonuclease subunit S [Providencia stuartii]
MSEWLIKSLDEVVEYFIDYRGKTPNKVGLGIPLITAKIVKNGRLLPATEFILQEDYDDWMSRGYPEINDVILTTEAPLGEVALLKNKNVALAQRIITLRGYKNKLNNIFLKYWLQSDFGQYELDSRASGTTVFGIKASVLKKIPIPVPPLPEQKAIASVLSSLDDKIDLLHRQNKTLESMAETLFRQWFVEEAQDDWEEVNVLNIFSLVGGGTPKTSIDEYWNGNIPWISGGDISQSHKGFISKTEKSITELGLKNSSTKLLPKLSTIISARGTVGKYALLEQEMCFSQSNYGIIPKGHNCYYFVYLLIGFIVDELLAAAYGSVFDTITTRTFESVDLKLPEMTVIANFEKTVIEFFKKKESNTKQIQTLENLRDTLLPKLMSGEVRVNYRPEEIKQ